MRYSNGSDSPHGRGVTPLLRAIEYVRRTPRLDGLVHCPRGVGYMSPYIAPLSMGSSEPYLIYGFLGPHESAAQMTSRLVQPFGRAYGRDRPRYSVCSNSPHLAVRAAMLARNVNKWPRCFGNWPRRSCVTPLLRVIVCVVSQTAAETGRVHRQRVSDIFPSKVPLPTVVEILTSI